MRRTGSANVETLFVTAASISRRLSGEPIAEMQLNQHQSGHINLAASNALADVANRIRHWI
jgi:hypothetical protein